VAAVASSGCGDGRQPEAPTTPPAAPAAGEAAEPTWDVKEMRACLREAGLRATVRRRKAGDEDAPDVRLVVFADPTAFVALYEDVRRARRYEPKIRSNVEAAGGEVERRGGVTVAWIGSPPRRLRARVNECAFA
jgi:hypothetical protein